MSLDLNTNSAARLECRNKHAIEETETLLSKLFDIPSDDWSKIRTGLRLANCLEACKGLHWEQQNQKILFLMTEYAFLVTSIFKMF